MNSLKLLESLKIKANSFRRQRRFSATIWTCSIMIAVCRWIWLRRRRALFAGQSLKKPAMLCNADREGKAAEGPSKYGHWFLTWLIFLLLDKQHGALAAWGLIRSAHIALDGWPQNQLGGTVAACNQNHVCLTNKNWVTDFIGNPESCTQMLNIVGVQELLDARLFSSFTSCQSFLNGISTWPALVSPCWKTPKVQSDATHWCHLRAEAMTNVLWWW